MNVYQKILTDHAPGMNPDHLETLAIAIGSTLNGMDRQFFKEISALARDMGAERLAEFHASQVSS